MDTKVFQHPRCVCVCACVWPAVVFRTVQIVTALSQFFCNRTAVHAVSLFCICRLCTVSPGGVSLFLFQLSLLLSLSLLEALQSLSVSVSCCGVCGLPAPRSWIQPLIFHLRRIQDQRLQVRGESSCLSVRVEPGRVLHGVVPGHAPAQLHPGSVWVELDQVVDPGPPEAGSGS